MFYVSCTQNVEKLQALTCGVTVDKWRGFIRDKLLIIKQKMTQIKTHDNKW